MANVLIRKLETFARLSAADKQSLVQMASERVRLLPARFDIIREGDKPTHVNLILEGWACRYKMLEDGRRQIIAFLLPGDMCDLNIFILREMDHSIAAMTPLRYAELTRDQLEHITLNHPRVLQALWWETLVFASVQREWSVNLGQRNAFERLGHLFCELYYRLESVGMTRGDTFDLPITQADLADATGLTPVHVNRTVRDLRAADLIVWRGKTLTIPDLQALQDASLFNANYLHLKREGRQFDANEVN